VCSYVLQRDRIRVLPGLGQKGVPQRMETRVRVGLDLFAQLCHLLFQYPRSQGFRRILRAREHVLAVGRFHLLFEYCLHLAINDQLAFPRATFQTPFDGELAQNLPVALVISVPIAADV
jgi:hypothetical protein